MTTPAVKDVGFCADFSQQGEWAFNYALSLARSQNLGMKVFYVPDLQWDPGNVPALPLEEEVALDRRVREHYEDKLGDFVEIGFRVCQGSADHELRRCLMGGVYQVLVLGYHDAGAHFAGRTIEKFAYAFNGPVVMVGPDRPDQFTINPSAALLSTRLGLDDVEWDVLGAQTPIAVGR